MDFRSAEELLEICKNEGIPVSKVMLEREISCGGMSAEAAERKMEKALSIMKASVRKAFTDPQPSMSGLLNGEAKKVELYEKKHPLCGSLTSRIIQYTMAVLEVNASMGVIVAAPTAGSSGVLPGTLIALQEEHGMSDELLCEGLFNAAAVGYLLTRNASVSGAEAGCQAEIGAASAMTASAVTEMMGGTPDMCLQAASMAISNLLGLVCDPVAGLVEIPCQSRNVTGALNALACAEIALSGVPCYIPFDQMAEAMLKVGRGLPSELRETAMGGCAATPAGCSMKCSVCE